jgi:Zinc carboxypeptidase
MMTPLLVNSLVWAAVLSAPQSTPPAPAPAPATAAPAAPPPPAPAPAGFTPVEARDAASLAAAIEDLRARFPSLVTVSSLGTSPRQKPIQLVTLSTDPSANRPSLLVVAGMDGTRWSTTEAALATAEDLVKNHVDLLGAVTVYVLPRGNPDPAEAFAKGPRRDYSGNGAMHDNDRDGRFEEDPPRDLDGNGLITQMRSTTILPPWSKPTLVADPADPRLMRAPDPKLGEVPVYTVWTEGIDTDGDGRIAEDGPGGIDPERNFPHRWPEFEDESGAYPLIATESKAIADFVIAHPGMFAALVLGRHDTVIAVPDGKAKTPSGMAAMIDEADAGVYAEVAKRWREIVGQKRADGADTAGSFVAWMNAQRGVPTFSSTLWGRPDVPAAEGDEGKDKDKDAKDAEPKDKKGKEKKGSKAEKAKAANEEEAAWLAYSDRVRGGAGFVAWKHFDHPQVRNLEIGGWVPGFRENPPLADVAPLGPKIAEFLVDVAGRRPTVALSQPTVVAVGPGLWRLDAVLTNTGRLPTVMRGGRADTVTPAHVVRVSVPVDRVKAGRKSDVVHGLDPGEARQLSWLLNAAEGETVTVELLFAGKPLQQYTFRDGMAMPAAPAAPAADAKGGDK